MAAFGLEDVAHKAVAAALVFTISQIEAPKHGNLTGIGGHSLEKTPD